MFELIQIFFRPGKVFARVRQKSSWILPFCAALICLTLPTVMVIGTAGIELLTLQRYQNDPKLADKMGETAVQNTIDSSNDRWTKMLVVSRVAGIAAAGMVVLAAAFMLATSIFDRRPPFFTMLGTLSFSIYPFALAGAIISFIVLVTSVEHSSLDLENMPALHLARFLDRDTANPAIFAMATQMDLLVAGEILLMSFGLTKITALNYIQALAICGGMWTLTVLWKTALFIYF